MKQFKHFVFGSLAATAMLFNTACTDEANLSPSSQPMAEELIFGNGSNEVTLYVDAEGKQMASRAIDYDHKHISDGGSADILIFAVYKKNADGTWDVADEFAKGYVGTQTLANLPADGQNAIDIVASSTTWPIKIRLATEPNETYKVAFWAQNSNSDAFDTEDLKKVTVNYAGAKNNNELRDAFCVVSKEFKGDTKEQVESILTRPFAQINVGTTGADYKNLLYGKYIYGNKAIQSSKIELKGISLANQIDVTTNTISAAEDFSKSVTFDYNLIPAYFNEKIWTGNVPGKKAGDDLTNAKAWADVLGLLNDEEALKVKLNKNTNEPRAYKTSYPTYYYYEDENGNKKPFYLTETFKYLSMCYVLVASNAGNDGKYQSTTIDNVTISFGEGPNATTEALTPIALASVPVCRNWRTNILGGLRWMKDPTDPDDPWNPTTPPDDPDDPDNPDDPTPDPDDPPKPTPGPDDPTPDPDDPDDPDDPTPTPPDGPDDPTSLFETVMICVHLDPIYDGEKWGNYEEADEKGVTIWFDTEFPNGSGSKHEGNINNGHENGNVGDRDDDDDVPSFGEQEGEGGENQEGELDEDQDNDGDDEPAVTPDQPEEDQPEADQPDEDPDEDPAVDPAE